mgnify:CR=1
AETSCRLTVSPGKNIGTKVESGELGARCLSIPAVGADSSAKD